MNNKVNYLPVKVSSALVKQVPFFEKIPEKLT